MQLEGCAARYMPSEEVELVLWADGDFHNRGERNNTIRFVFQNRLSLAPVGRRTETWEGVLAVSSCLFRCWQEVGKVLAITGEACAGAQVWGVGKRAAAHRSQGCPPPRNCRPPPSCHTFQTWELSHSEA